MNYENSVLALKVETEFFFTQIIFGVYTLYAISNPMIENSDYHNSICCHRRGRNICGNGKGVRGKLSDIYGTLRDLFIVNGYNGQRLYL